MVLDLRQKQAYKTRQCVKMSGGYLNGRFCFRSFYDVSRDGEHNKDLLSP